MVNQNRFRLLSSNPEGQMATAFQVLKENDFQFRILYVPNPNVSRQIKHVSDIQVLKNSYLEPLPQEVSRTQVRR